MADRAFIIQQVGVKESNERKRANEIHNHIVAPAVRDAGLEPYRADLDLSPGAITPKILSELLAARLVIADLTGRNPNVFYELGITHSFARPLISIADSSSALPFDAKDERVIELGEYAANGLGFAQGMQARAALQECLKIVLSDDYSPPSPLLEVAANRSVDQLAPNNPIAAELAQMRESIEDIRKKVTARGSSPSGFHDDTTLLRNALQRNVGYLEEADLDSLTSVTTSPEHDAWAKELREAWQSTLDAKGSSDPWAQDAGGFGNGGTGFGTGGTSDEPPF